MRTKDVGKGLVDALSDDNENVIIESGKNQFEASGSKRTVFWKPGDKNGGLDAGGSTKRPSFIALGHELAHAYDAVSDNIMDFDEWFKIGGKPIPNAEQFATHIENQLRNEHGVTLRKYYGENEGEGQILNNNISLFYNSTVIITFKQRLNPPFNYKYDKSKF